jgi:hypothetical protein
MPRATNPSNLKRKSKATFAENEIGSDSEGVSEYENSNETSSESEGEETSKTTISKKEKAKKEKLEVEVDESVVDAREKSKRKKMSDRKDKKKQNSKSSKKMKKDYGMFDESDVKIDMSNENLKPQKIKVASNLLVESRVITVDEPGSKFSYPGIVIVRKMNDGKSFEFNFPITVASRIASAIEIIMKNNEN